jgi:hypothetical protein
MAIIGDFLHFNSVLDMSFAASGVLLKDDSNNSSDNTAGKPNVNPYLEQAMVGLLLGDGTLVKKYVGGGTYFKYAQSIIHGGYLHHVFELFHKQGLLNMLSPSPGTSVIKGVTYHWFQFTSKSFAGWNALHALWYVNGVKVIPNNIQELLTPVAIAYWFMDDGGWTKTGIHLATNCFSEGDTLRLMAVLQEVYGLKCTVHSRNRIYIWAKSTEAFINMVKPHMHSNMAYKLGPSVLSNPHSPTKS